MQKKNLKLIELNKLELKHSHMKNSYHSHQLKERDPWAPRRRSSGA